MNGVLNVYKEQGFTSHDVVAKLRGILKTKKIGHTGTLDPDAVGVLPVCIGKATKLCDLITDWGKTYEAVMLLGTTTDTLDISGKIVAQSEVNVSEVDVLKACNEFIGEYEQIPPMYSAKKIDGKKFSKDMIMRPYAIQNDIKAGLKKYFGVVTDDELMDNLQLNNELYNINNLPLPETDPWITKDGVFFSYAPYEIASYAAGAPSFVIPISKVKNHVTSTAKTFFDE